MRRLYVLAVLASLAVLVALNGGCQSRVAPEAVFAYEPEVGEAPLTVSFDASASRGEIVAYSWDFGDGATGSGVTVKHSFVEHGRHLVRLTVRNRRGQEDSKDGVVHVHPRFQPPPG